MNIDANTEVNATSLAATLGLTPRRVYLLAQDGVISAAGKGKYPLADAVQRYIEYRTAKKPPSHTEQEKLNADVAIKKARATILSLEAKELQGKMHRSEDVAELTADLIYTVRAALIALPGRLAVEVIHAKSTAEASEIIRAEVYRVMESLANYEYDPKRYEERVRDRNNWGSDEWDDEEQP